MKRLVLMAVALGGCTQTDLAARPCNPGDLECTEDGAVRVCNENGSAWINGLCSDDQTCVAGDCDDPLECPDVCRDVVCTPGATFCGGNNIFQYACDATGTTGCFVKSCAAPPPSGVDGVCFQGECVSTCGAGQKSYLGCEYFAVDLDNAFVDCDGVPGGDFCDAAGQQYALAISNPDPDRIATVIVTQGDLPEQQATAGECLEPGAPDPPENFVDAEIIPPRGIKVFKLPSTRGVNATVLDDLAFRVASNIPVTVYQFNPLENVGVFSNDASMLMPTTAADEEYYVMSRAQFTDQLRGYFSVVGINEEPTVVTIVTTESIGPGPGVPQQIEANTPVQFTLNRFDVLNLSPNRIGADLTGSYVLADRPVIVYGGHEAGVAPTPMSECLPTGVCADDDTRGCSTDFDCLGDIPCCADHLEQQLFPTSTWGNDYLAVRSYPRGNELDVWRILASERGVETEPDVETVITLDPPVANVPPLKAGEWFEFESGIDFEIHAECAVDDNRYTCPIMVGQFLAGEQSREAGIGDPAFMLAVPVRQFRETYVFLAPGVSDAESIGYEEDYVSIAVKENSVALLDGETLEEVAADRPGLVLIEPIADSGYLAYRIPIEDGFHSLTCFEPCSVMVHGYDSFVSYGYPGGLNLLECTENSDCKFPTLVCDDEDFSCVECLVDDDCVFNPAERFCGPERQCSAAPSQ